MDHQIFMVLVYRFIQCSSTAARFAISVKSDGCNECKCYVGEARCTVNSQQIILWHLKNFFGRRITVQKKKFGNLRRCTPSYL
jgi:hypothetical protein